MFWPDKFPYFSLTIFLLCFNRIASAQNFISLDRNFLNRYESRLYDGYPNIHTTVKPFVLPDEPHFNYPLKNIKRKYSSALHRSPEYAGGELNAYLLTDIGIGNPRQKWTDNGWRKSAGIGMSLSYRSRLAMELCIFGGGYSFPEFLRAFPVEKHLYPGLGEIENGSYMVNGKGNITWRPSRYFHFQAGADKHFWGDGYRSLFLSDVPSPYPFLRITTTFWNVQYVNLYTWMKNIRLAPANLRDDLELTNKYATMHILSWNITRRVNLSVFEAVIWKGTDDALYRSYDLNYLNPVIFYRPVEYSTGSNDNALLGLNFKIRPARKLMLYSQVLFDEFLLKEMKADIKKFIGMDISTSLWGWYSNKYGLQGGMKYFDVLGIKNLILQGEVNTVRPYTYSHGNEYQNYSHLGQPLAHPLGSNFSEGLVLLDYSIRDFYVNCSMVYSIHGSDSGNSNWGGDIFKSIKTREQEYYNVNGQGIKNTLWTAGITKGYMIYEPSHLAIEAKIFYRQKQSGSAGETNIFFIVGIKTKIFNEYYDY